MWQKEERGSYKAVSKDSRFFSREQGVLVSMAVSFLLGAVSFPAVGLAAVWTIVARSDDEGMGHFKGDSPACFFAERESTHTIVHVATGTARTIRKLLLRVDTVENCSESSEGVRIEMHRADLLSSLSTACDLEALSGGPRLCAEKVLVSPSAAGYAPQTERVATVRVGVSTVSSDWDPIASSYDGQIRICQGVRAVVGRSRVCFHVYGSETWRPPSQASEATSLRSDGRYLRTTEKGAADTRECFNRAALLLPASSLLWRTWNSLSIGQFDQESDSWRRVDAVLGSGLECLSNSSSYEQRRTAAAVEEVCARTAYEARDSTLRAICDGERSFAAHPLATSGFSFGVDLQGRGEFRAWTDDSLHSLRRRVDASLGDENAGFDPLALRLVVMIFAALILWTQQEDQTSRTDVIFTTSLMCALNTDAGSAQFAQTAASRGYLSRALDLLAVAMRVSIALTFRESLVDDALGDVVFLELVASGVSLVHCLHLLLVSPTRRRCIGGSTSLLDVACSTMVAFAETPLVGSGDSFASIARLLTAMLVTMTCVSRVAFSLSATSSALAEERAVYFVSGGIAFLSWILLSSQTALVTVGLFVVPFVRVVARRGTDEVSHLATAVLVSIVSVGACPRFTANARALVVTCRSV